MFSLLNRGGFVILSFLNVFFLVRMMPKSEIGTWVLFTSVTTFLEMIRNGFIRNPLIAYYVSAEGEDEKRSIVTASLVIHGILSLFIAAVILLGATPLADFWSAPGLDRLFVLYAINSIIFIPFFHFEYLLSAAVRFKGIFFSNAIRLGLLSIYIITHFISQASLTLVELATVQIIGTVAGCVVSYGFVKDMLFLNLRIDRDLVKRLFHFGKFTFGTNVSSILIKNTDSWMIGRIISAASVAVYTPAIKLSNIVEVPTLAIASLIFPQVFKKMREQGKEGVSDIYIKSVSLILAVMIPVIIPIYVFAEEIIALIFGSEYREAAPILQVTIFYTLLIPFNRQFGTVMDALKTPKLNFYLLVMMAVLNIIFNYIFLKQFGLIGSAFGTLLSYCIIFVVNQVILKRMYGIKTFRVLEGIMDWYKLGWSILMNRIIKLA